MPLTVDAVERIGIDVSATEAKECLLSQQCVIRDRRLRVAGIGKRGIERDVRSVRRRLQSAEIAVEGFRRQRDGVGHDLIILDRVVAQIIRAEKKIEIAVERRAKTHFLIELLRRFLGNILRHEPGWSSR